MIADRFPPRNPPLPPELGENRVPPRAHSGRPAAMPFRITPAHPIEPRRPLFRFALLLALLLGSTAGCKRKQQEVPPPKPPAIPVSHLVEREVTDFAEYTGRTDAVQSVSVRAR